ncbi:MAG: hypothetical protein AB1413_07190 [Thermodesulfobacteriota bacterium]
MTFACTNYDYNTDKCQKLKTDCIPGRPGCVLEGKVRLSDELQKRISGIKEAAAKRRKSSTTTRKKKS